MAVALPAAPVAVSDAESPDVEPADRVDLLDGGREAFPRMLAAIAAARTTVYLEVYAFSPNGWGRLFLDAALLYFVHGMIREKLAGEAISTARGLVKHFPKFALGLIAFSALATFHFWSKAAVENLNHLYRWAFLLGFAGVGLRTSLRRLRTRGVRPLALALGVQTITAGIMLVCVRMLF